MSMAHGKCKRSFSDAFGLGSNMGALISSCGIPKYHNSVAFICMQVRSLVAADHADGAMCWPRNYGWDREIDTRVECSPCRSDGHECSVWVEKKHKRSISIYLLSQD